MKHLLAPVLLCLLLVAPEARAQLTETNAAGKLTIRINQTNRTLARWLYTHDTTANGLEARLAALRGADIVATAVELQALTRPAVLYDGSTWLRKAGAITTGTVGYGGIKLPGAGGQHYERQYSGPVDPKWFGAKGDGTTNDTPAILAALAAATKAVRLERGVFMADEITVPAGKTLLIEEGATLRQRAYSNSGEKALVRLSTGSKLLGKGILDGNAPNLAASRTNNSALNYGIFVQGDSVEISGVTVRNTITLSLWALSRKALRVSNYTEQSVGRGAQFVRCENVTLTNYVSENFNGIYANVYPHVLDFIYCKSVRVSGVRILNVNASSAAPSDAISGLTALGNSDSVFENLSFDGFLSAVKVGLPIADDGSQNCIFRSVIISNWKYSCGVEVQGSRNTTYSDFHIDGTTLSNTASGTVGMHILDTSINGGTLPEATADVQGRDRALANNLTFNNIFIEGGYAGFRVASSYATFTNCVVRGAYYGWRIQQMQGGTLTNWWRTPILQRINNNLFINSGAELCEVGVANWGGQDNRWINPRITNCGVGITSVYRVLSNVTAATSTTATLVSSQTANAYKGYLLYVTNGPGLGQARRIASHTATEYTVESAWTTTPDATSEVVIVDDPQGTIYLDNPEITDNQTFALAGAASFPVLDTNPASLTQLTIAYGAERFAYNQKLRLKNVITGASSPDLIVRITAIDKTTRDRFYVTPLTLGDGTALAGTLAPTLTSGTGTLTTSNFGVYATSFGQIDGSSTDLPNQIDGNYWIKIGSVWRQVFKANSDTQYWVTESFPTPAAGQSFQITKVDVEGIPAMTNGISFNRYYGDVVFSGETRITGASGVALNVFRSRSVNTLELTPNAVAPSVVAGSLFKTANTSATAYTNFTGATIGKRITILVGDANTTFAYVVGSLKGYSANYLASVGDVLTATYDGTQWLTQIIPAAGRFKLFEFGDAAATTPVLNLYGGSGGADLARFKRTAGITAEYGLGVGSSGFYVRDVTSAAIVGSNVLAGSTRRFILGNDKGTAAAAGEVSAESITGALSNSPGGPLTLSAGKGTGNATPSVVTIRTPNAGNSGAATQELADRVKIETAQTTILNPLVLSGYGTGLLKANGASPATLASPNVDYQSPITLTTTGTSGAATLTGSTLNIPQYTGGSGSSHIVYLTAPTTLVALQNAINALPQPAGGTIKIIGSGRVSGTVRVDLSDKQNITIEGSGADTLYSSTMPSLLFITNTGTNTTRNIILRGLNFRSDFAGTTGLYPLLWSNENAQIDGWLVENCSFTSPNAAINAFGMVTYDPYTFFQGKTCRNVHLNRNKFFNVGRMGVEVLCDATDGVYRMQGFWLTNNYAINLGIHGAGDGDGQFCSFGGLVRDITITGNRILDARDIGIEAVRVKNVYIEGNHLDYTDPTKLFNGIQVSSATTENVVIGANYIRTKGRAFNLNNASMVTMTGGVYESEMRNEVNNCSYVTLSGLQVYSTDVQAIQFHTCTHPHVTGSTFRTWPTTRAASAIYSVLGFVNTPAAHFQNSILIRLDGANDSHLGINNSTVFTGGTYTVSGGGGGTLTVNTNEYVSK